MAPRLHFALPMFAHLPSLESLEANDDAQISAELCLARLRAQVAVVRTLADHIERFASPGNADGMTRQILDETARLGRRLCEAAASIPATPRDRDSGTCAREGSVTAAVASTYEGPVAVACEA